MHFKLFLLNIGRVSIFNTVSNSHMQKTYADPVWIDTGVCGLLHGVFTPRTVREVQVWIIEHSLKVMEIQEPQEYAQTQFSEERRQRISHAKKRYHCYTENIVIVTRYKIWKRDSDVPQVIMKRKQQDAQAKAAKHCSTVNRQQEAQAMAAKHRSELLRSTRSAVSTRYCCSCVFMFKYLMYTL